MGGGGGGGITYHILASAGVITVGVYHLISTTRNYLKSPRDYSAKPYHPICCFSSSDHHHHHHHHHHHRHHLIRHLQLYLVIIGLLIAFLHQTLIISPQSDPLLKGRTPVHLFSSLQHAAVLFLFLLLSTSLLLSESTSLLPLPPDLFFALSSALFFLLFSVSSSSASFQTSDLQSKCYSLSARVSALSSLLCLLLACLPRLFLADAALGASLCLQGLWLLQTGLSLHVDAFVPEGCHKLLDVVGGVEGSTKCDLEDSMLRAVAILDFLFILHVMLVLLLVILTYAALARTVGVRRFGSYEALPTLASSPAPIPSDTSTTTTTTNHIQMKSLTGTQA